MGPLSQVLTVSVVLTMFSIINFLFLVYAISLICVKFVERHGEPLRGLVDLGNLPLLSSLLSETERYRGTGEKTVSYHAMRHIRMCILAGPHVWVKTSLLSISWAKSSTAEKLNMVLADFCDDGRQNYHGG